MKTTIFYFSGTGNTWYIANSIKEELVSRGHESECYSVENEILKDDEELGRVILSSDRIILGFPTYGSALPRPMEDFVKRLPKQEEKKKTAAFCTKAFGAGDGASFFSDELEEKGYDLRQSYHFIMSNNFYVPVFIKFLPVGDMERIRKRNEKAVSKIPAFVSMIVEDKKHLMGENPWGHLLGKFQRNHVKDLIVQINDSIYVENDRCVNCNLCVKICPMGNISASDGNIEIGNNCCSCMRCYQQCPKAAINLTEKSLDTNEFPRYKGPVENFNVHSLKK